MTTGERIRNARKNAEMTQKALGKALGVSPQMIAQYENGNRIPKLETLRRIAAALEVPLYEISDWSQYTPDDFLEDFSLSENETEEILILTKKEAQQALDKELLDYIHLLDDNNQEKVVKYAYDLTKIPEYRKK